MKRGVLLILYILLISVSGLTQDVEFTVSAPKVVSAGEQFRLTYSVNTRPSQFLPPQFENFIILAGPSTSSNSSVQIINGKMTQSYSYTYTYILQASKEGNFTLPPAEITVKRKKYVSDPLQIEVIKGTVPQPDEPGDQEQQIPGISNEDLFVRVLVNKTRAYQGEHIVATIKVYSRLNIVGFGDIKLWKEKTENDLCSIRSGL